MRPKINRFCWVEILSSENNDWFMGKDSIFLMFND